MRQDGLRPSRTPHLWFAKGVLTGEEAKSDSSAVGSAARWARRRTTEMTARPRAGSRGVASRAANTAPSSLASRLSSAVSELARMSEQVLSCSSAEQLLSCSSAEYFIVHTVFAHPKHPTEAFGQIAGSPMSKNVKNEIAVGTEDFGGGVKACRRHLVSFDENRPAEARRRRRPRRQR